MAQGGAEWGDRPREGEGSPPPAGLLVLPNVGDVDGPVFLGRFVHQADDKRRVALPKTFREEIQKERDGEALFLVQAFDPCLWLFTESRFQAFRKRLAQMQEGGYGVGDQKVRAFRREIFSRSAKIALDKQGRLALPDIARSVGIDREVIFLGVDEKVELWSPEADAVKDDPVRLQKLSQELIG